MPDSRGLSAADSILQDLRYTFRTLRRDSGFTTFAVLIVGLGIGASATVFSVVDALLLRPLPFQRTGAAGLDRQLGHQRRSPARLPRWATSWTSGN
jgi:hypothetical protein